MTRKWSIVPVFLLALSTFAPPPGAARALADSRSKAVVRPGAKVLYDGTYCTMNFVFRGSDGHDYVGTAGHCPFETDQAGIKTWRKGKGIEAADVSGIRIGEFAFAAFSRDDDYDLALIRLDDAVKPDPEMEVFGGPTGINDDITHDAEVLNMYGHGMVLGDVKRDRHLLAPGGFDDRESIFATGVAIFGDSGSPVTTDEDEALGILSQGAVAARIPDGGVPYPANTIIVRLPHNLALAEDILDLRLTLRTARP